MTYAMLGLGAFSANKLNCGDVRWLQTALKGLGYYNCAKGCGIDGIMGLNTLKAMGDFTLSRGGNPQSILLYGIDCDKLKQEYDAKLSGGTTTPGGTGAAVCPVGQSGVPPACWPTPKPIPSSGKCDDGDILTPAGCVPDPLKPKGKTAPPGSPATEPGLFDKLSSWLSGLFDNKGAAPGYGPGSGPGPGVPATVPSGEMPATTKLAIGVGVVALLGGAIYLGTSKPSAAKSSVPKGSPAIPNRKYFPAVSKRTRKMSRS